VGHISPNFVVGTPRGPAIEVSPGSWQCQSTSDPPGLTGSGASANAAINDLVAKFRDHVVDLLANANWDPDLGPTGFHGDLERPVKVVDAEVDGARTARTLRAGFVRARVRDPSDPNLWIVTFTPVWGSH